MNLTPVHSCPFAVYFVPFVEAVIRLRRSFALQILALPVRLKKAFNLDSHVRKGFDFDRPFWEGGFVVLFSLVQPEYSDGSRRDINQPIFWNPGFFG